MFTKIIMTKTTKGSENGLDVNTYKAGETYQMMSNLAKIFVDVLRVAKKVNEEEKSIMSAPENKMIDPVEEVKQEEGVTEEVKPEESEYVYSRRGRR